MYGYAHIRYLCKYPLTCALSFFWVHVPVLSLLPPLSPPFYTALFHYKMIEKTEWTQDFYVVPFYATLRCEKQDTVILSVTLPNFKRFFHCWSLCIHS